MIKVILLVVVAVPLLLLVTPTTFAQGIPRPSGFVNDLANVIADGAQAELETALAAFERETTVEVAVVTVPTLGNDTVEGYAVRLFEEWGIGKKGVDNGVLLLLAVQERRVRIEVGYGMEPYLPDGKAGRILDETVIPSLRQNDYTTGLANGARAIVQAIQGSGYEPGSVRERPSAGLPFEVPAGFLWALFALGAASLYAFSYFTRSKRIWPGGAWGAAAGALLGWLGGGFLGLAVGAAVVGAVGLLMDALLSSAYRYQKSSGRPTDWRHSWGGWYGAGHGTWGSSRRGGGGFGGGFGGGRSGGGGASRGF